MFDFRNTLLQHCFRAMSTDRTFSTVAANCLQKTNKDMRMRRRLSYNLLLPIVSHIVVTSLQSSVMSEKYKTSYISPLLKKIGLNPESLLNYRPISNLPFISKVIERVVAKQLTVYLQENDLHDQFQSAYRKDHSTETALIKVHNDILYVLSIVVVSLCWSCLT